MKYLLLLTLAFNVHAITVEQCSTDAISYGNQSGTPKIFPTTCFPVLWGLKTDSNYDESGDNYVQSVGVKNMLHTKVYTLDAESNPILSSEHVITGKLSLLHEVQAVDFNEADGRIYVLNKASDGHQQVYSYPHDVGGNYAPRRALKGNNEVDAASNIRMDATNIFLISKTGNWIKVFNRAADPWGPKTEHSTATLRTVSGSNTGLNAPVDIAESGTELFVLEATRIAVFNKTDSGNITPKRVIEGPATTLAGAKKIEVSFDGLDLEVTNGSGSVIKFLKTGNGNISPK